MMFRRHTHFPVILNLFQDLLLFQQDQEHGNRDEILKQVQNDDFLFEGEPL